MRFLALAVLAFAVMAGFGGGARAAPGAMTFNCPHGCVLDPGNLYFDDYTLPSDGLTHEWDFWLFSSDPNATVTLDAPNEWFTAEKLGGHSGFDTFDFNTPFVFDQHVAPLFTSITVGTGADFDTCSPATPLGELCAATYNVWGNATQLRLNSSARVTLFTSDPHVPEPATWTMMILGCGAVGAALRRRRALRRAA